VAGDADTWQTAEWFRALTLAERARLPCPPAAAGDPGRAPARLEDWRRQKPFDRDALFAERLAQDGLTEEDLPLLLGEPPEQLRERVAATPGWLVALRDAFAEQAAAEKLLPLLDEVQPDDALHGCLRALAPLLHRGARVVQDRAAQLRECLPGPTVDASTVTRAFLDDVVPTVLFQISKPIVLELHIARLRGRLDGHTPDARFESFLRHLAGGGLESLLVKYPVLGRQLVTVVDQSGGALAELVDHLHADWPALRTTFAGGADPGALVNIQAGKGDRHRRGRSVTLLQFESGLRLVHKPRSMAVDVHFQELLSWLNERGAQPRLRTLAILDRGSYGWSQFVAAAPCSSEEEVSRFFERQGAYLALLHALHATDVHNENLIAAGEDPVLVDLEALFHPHLYGDDRILSVNRAAAALDQSVWQVGILPRRVWSDDGSIGVDMSGLGGQAGQLNPHRLVGWDERGSDAMRLTRGRAVLPVSENRPRLGDQDVDVLDHGHAVVAGFVRMYRLLCLHRMELLDGQLPRFADDEIRAVVRSTNVYGLLWYESFHPDLLRDALDRDRYLDRLWAEVAHRRSLTPAVPFEQRDLLRSDIPVFTTTPADRDLIASDGERLRNFLGTPSLELARERLAGLGEDDLATQTWIIEASLATLVMDREDRIGRPTPVRPTAPATREQLTGLAGTIGRRLGELVLRSATGAHWLGVGPLDDVHFGVFPSGTDLYAGTAGIALFLAHLGAVTGDEAHTELARQAVASLRAGLRPWLSADRADGDEDGPPPPVGGFDGLGSTVYVLTQLGALWDDPVFLTEAETLAERLPELIDVDERLDVIYGSAGCLLALLALHAVRPSGPALGAAVRCGERLLGTARPMAEGIAWSTLADQPELGGFSHGTAGIAYALLRLASGTGDPRFAEAARAALAFDRSLFVPELGNWADLRVFPSRGTPADGAQSMVAWCHGAPGIGLSRLAAPGFADDPRARKEVDTALSATTGFGFAINHSLCHGALGNAELLLTAARVLGRPQDLEALERATAEIVAGIDAGGPVTGVPLGVETPGFMVGLSGIGYQLLRLAEPDRVPCALLLAPPFPRSHS
jgi:type 2 lantibiotic biosynthesis protein LanM